MGMSFLGPEPRAADMRRAANRLRWEIDYALGEGRDEQGISNALGNIAETLGILRQVTEALDGWFPPGHPERGAFVHLAEYYAGYHRTPR